MTPTSAPSTTTPTTQAFACPHNLEQAQDAVWYKVAACTTAASRTGRYYYEVLDECYIPGHDCRFNVVDDTVNAWLGKRDRDNESFRRPESLHKEAKDFGEKKTEVDADLAKKICALAQANKFIYDQNDPLAQSIKKAKIFQTE